MQSKGAERYKKIQMDVTLTKFMTKIILYFFLLDGFSYENTHRLSRKRWTTHHLQIRSHYGHIDVCSNRQVKKKSCFLNDKAIPCKDVRPGRSAMKNIQISRRQRVMMVEWNGRADIPEEMCFYLRIFHLHKERNPKKMGIKCVFCRNHTIYFLILRCGHRGEECLYTRKQSVSREFEIRIRRNQTQL